MQRTSQGRLLKKRLREAQGKPADAVANLRLASGYSAPALAVFEQYNVALLSEERFQEVLRQSTRAEKMFADEAHFLPEEIYITVVRAGDGVEAKADALLNRCLSAPRRDLWKICEAARIGVDASFRQSASAILAANCAATECDSGGFKLPWRWKDLNKAESTSGR